MMLHSPRCTNGDSQPMTICNGSITLSLALYYDIAAWFIGEPLYLYSGSTRGKRTRSSP